MEKEEDAPHKYAIEGETDRTLKSRLATSLKRPPRILLQPIVLTMSLYQALLFSTVYSLYTNFQEIYEGEYGFNTEQVGLLYLGPGIGFLLAIWIFVPQIDTIYNKLTARNHGKAKPEFRLPIANIGAILVPASLFWFAWAVQEHTAWYVSVASTPFFGIGMTCIMNCAQNYYIDSFQKYAASAIAAGAVFRSLIGGVVPLFIPALLDRIGYGWGISTFAFVGVLLAPAPLFFYFFGARIRERFAIDLE